MGKHNPEGGFGWLIAGVLVVIAFVILFMARANEVKAADGSVGTAAWAIHGEATWYDAPSRIDAAAGPRLRSQLGPHWRGMWVRIHRGAITEAVHLTDWCACADRNGLPTLVDLDDRMFAAFGPLSAGVLTVDVSPLKVTILPPPTDTAPAPSSLPWAPLLFLGVFGALLKRKWRE